MIKGGDRALPPFYLKNHELLAPEAAGKSRGEAFPRARLVKSKYNEVRATS